MIEDGDEGSLAAQAAWDAGRSSLVVAVINYSDREETIEPDLSALAFSPVTGEADLLTAPSLSSHNTFAAPGEITARKDRLRFAGEPSVRFTVPPRSLCRLVLW